VHSRFEARGEGYQRSGRQRPWGADHPPIEEETSPDASQDWNGEHGSQKLFSQGFLVRANRQRNPGSLAKRELTIEEICISPKA
jgi:hypothetical protein